MTINDLYSTIARGDHEPFKVVADGEIVVLTGQGRIFLYNRTSRIAVEVLPDSEQSFYLVSLGRVGG